MNKYVEIIVTYNRINLLKENIKALQNQTFENHDIMIIDNASTDGTKEYVNTVKDSRIVYYNTEKNLGGAGGFSFGIKKAFERGYEYAWIMDDDSIPKDNALESLIKKTKMIDNNFSFLASLVYWTDNRLFNMNIPSMDFNRKDKAKNIIEKRNEQLELISKYKILKIKTCSFVGCFINMNNASKVGLPISEFFIYGDDEEYTSRLNKVAPAYLDLDSIIIHKAPSNKGADVVTSDKDRIQRFYYQSRNGMYIARKEKKILRRLLVVTKRIIRVIMFSTDCKFKRIVVLIKGTVEGLWFNPKIEFVKYKDNRGIKNEI